MGLEIREHHSVFRQRLVISSCCCEEGDEVAACRGGRLRIVGHDFQELQLPVGSRCGLPTKRLHLGQSGQGRALVGAFEKDQLPQAVASADELLTIAGGGQ